MRKHRQEIIKANSEIGRLFARAYRYLKAAWNLHEDSGTLYSLAIDVTQINKMTKKFIDELFDEIPLAENVGKQRCLFASAITPDGLKNYLDDLMTTKNIYMLEGFPGARTEQMLESIKTAAVERGLDIEAYYCALNPEKLEHLIIPELNTGFTTVNTYHGTDVCALRKIDFKEMLDKNTIEMYKSELDFNQTEFDRLLNKAISVIHGAKALHDEMETYYIPNMDFDALQLKWDETLKRILAYAGEV